MVIFHGYVSSPEGNRDDFNGYKSSISLGVFFISESVSGGLNG